MRPARSFLILAAVFGGCGTLLAQQPMPTPSRPIHAVARDSDASSSDALQSARLRHSTTECDRAENARPALAAALARLASSSTADNHRAVGDAYREAGILDMAFDQYALATRLDPSNGAAWEGIARTWRDWGFPGLGLGDAHRARFHAPDSPSARNTLGTILDGLGHHALARAHYQGVLAIDPTADYALNNLCYSWLLDGQAALAFEACRLAVAVSPGLAAARSNLSIAEATLSVPARSAGPRPSGSGRRG